MLKMSINPEQDVQDQLQATMAAAPPAAAYMQPVDPHASLTAPIGPAPQPAPTMASPKSDIAVPTKMANQEDQLSSRLNADYAKDNTPSSGFFGHLMGGLDAAIPGVMSQFRGTKPYREKIEEPNLEGRLQALSKQDSEEGLQGAQTKKVLTDEQGDELENANKPQEQADTHQRLQDEHQTTQDAIAQGPSLATAYAHAVNQALKENRDPAADPVVQHLQDAITGLQKQSATPPGTKTVQLQVNGKPHQVLVDERTGQTVKDLGESGEKPPVVNVNAGNAALDRETSRFAKPYEKGVSDANSQLEKIADARSMVNGSAEAQALGIPKVLTALVSGAGSGVRITQPELNAIAKARGLAGDVEGTLNSLAGQGKLTDTQKKQLTGILDDVKNRIEAKRDIHSQTLDSINGASSREDIVKADKDARQKINDLETKGFYVGQHTPKGTVVGFNPKTGGVLIDDAR